jgi:hypothetical protein
MANLFDLKVFTPIPTKQNMKKPQFKNICHLPHGIFEIIRTSILNCSNGIIMDPGRKLFMTKTWSQKSRDPVPWTVRCCCCIAGMNLLNIVKFPNGPCTTAGNSSGVCYTASECQKPEVKNLVSDSLYCNSVLLLYCRYEPAEYRQVPERPLHYSRQQQLGLLHSFRMQKTWSKKSRVRLPLTVGCCCFAGMNLLNIVKFPNGPCTTAGNITGSAKNLKSQISCQTLLNSVLFLYCRYESAEYRQVSERTLHHHSRQQQRCLLHSLRMQRNRMPQHKLLDTNRQHNNCLAH